MKSQPTINLSTRLSPELKEQLDKYRQETDKSVREIVEEALTEYLKPRK